MESIGIRISFASLPAKQSIPFARATITMTRTTTIITMITIIPTVNEFESAAERKIEWFRKFKITRFNKI